MNFAEKQYVLESSIIKIFQEKSVEEQEARRTWGKRWEVNVTEQTKDLRSRRISEQWEMDTNEASKDEERKKEAKKKKKKKKLAANAFP